MTANRTTTIAVAASLALHGLVALVAPDELPEAAAREPAKPPQMVQLRSLPVRVVEPPPPPPTKPEPPPPVTPPPPKQVAEAPAPAPPAKKKPVREKKRTVKRPRPPKKRRPGRTMTASAEAPAAAPTTAIPSGDGDPIELGEWDPSATDAEVARPASDFEPAGADDGDDDGVVAAAPALTPEPGPLVPPVPRSRPVGRYPADAPATLGDVEVALALQIDTRGRVASARVVRGAGPVFDREARRLARTIRFEPARRGDKPIAMTIPWTVTFK